MTHPSRPGVARASDLVDAEAREIAETAPDRPDPLDMRVEPSNAADRLGFEPFAYAERS